VPGTAGTGRARELPELRIAAEAVLEGIRDDDTAIGLGEVRAALAELVDELERRPVPEESGHDPALQRKLMGMLRERLVGIWSGAKPAPDSGHVLDLLGRMESISARLAARIPGHATLGYPTALEFVAGVAHDLRSPLTSILFLAETLRAGQSGPVTEGQRRQLGIVYAAALGLVSVASDIIELVRGGEGLTERTPTPFSLTEMLESVHDIVRPMAEERGLGVHLFPPAVDHRLGHPLALSRVLLNLTTNGLKYTESGFVEITIREFGERRVEFSVRDTGRGIDPAALQNLYRPFRRSADGRRQGFSGTGLGLAISRKLVAAMAAELNVEVRSGWGTRFWFELDLPPAPKSGD